MKNFLYIDRENKYNVQGAKKEMRARYIPQIMRIMLYV